MRSSFLHGLLHHMYYVCLTSSFLVNQTFEYSKQDHSQGAKKVILTACHLGKLKLTFASPNIISISPKNVFDEQIDFTVLL